MPNGPDISLQVGGSASGNIQMQVDTGGQGSASNAEAWAVGQRHGVDVGSGDPTYHNSSKYWAQRSAASATDATKYPKVQNSTWWVWNASTQEYVDTGVYATWHISKTYSSISAMNSDYSGTDVKVGEYVMIVTNSVEDADNAKIYLKGDSAYIYVADLSGATGIQGPKGDRGLQGIDGQRGADGAQGIQGIQGPQ